MSDSNGYVCLDKHSRVVANHLVCYPADAMNMIARQAGCKTAALLPASSRTRALQSGGGRIGNSLELVYGGRQACSFCVLRDVRAWHSRRVAQGGDCLARCFRVHRASLTRTSLRKICEYAIHHLVGRRRGRWRLHRVAYSNT